MDLSSEQLFTGQIDATELISGVTSRLEVPKYLGTVPKLVIQIPL